MMEPEEIWLANRVINDLEEAEADAAQHIVGPRFHYKRRFDPFQLSERNFMKNYRVLKNLAREIIQMVRPFMVEGRRISDISIETKVMVALNFFAHGSYQESVGKHMCHTLSQPSISRCIKEVTDALNEAEIQRRLVHFPQNLRELEELRLRFFLKYDFPGIIGIIDCTHIAIFRPHQDEDIYMNRKNYHSLNVQLICDERLKILSVNARFPGTCHDARIWQQSNISAVLENIHNRIPQPFFLLGDLGYPLRPWLLTQLQHVEPGSPDERFNRRFVTIRSSIERCNGRLKNMWRCLLKDRVLHYSPEAAASITKACVILHNLCIDHNIPEPDIQEVAHLDFGMYAPAENEFRNANEELAAGRLLRQRIINNHFA